MKSAPDSGGSGKREDYLYVEDVAGLLQCVQMGTIEFHGWGSTLRDPDRPDRIVFDLDPDEGLDFSRVASAAFLVRDELKSLGLTSFAMLSGGKGVHVIVPLVPKADWDEVRDFSRRFSQALAEALPDKFTAELRKIKRKGRIFIDHLRNQRSSTAVMPWTVRARPNAPVAAPISWDELRETKSSGRFTLADQPTLKMRVTELNGWGRADQTLPNA